MINVIAGNDFRLIVTAKKSVGVSVGVLDLTEVDDLRIYLTRAGRSKMSQSYALDDYGRAIVYVNARDVAVGVYGIELMGVMGGSNLRAHKTNVLTVSGHGHGNEGVLLDYEVDIVLSVNVPTTDAYVQAAIEAHNEDENAHPGLQTKIAGKVDDVLVDGESVVETDPVTGKRTVGFRKDQFGKVDDVLVNGESVVGEGGVARINSQDFKGERGNGITSIDVEESQVDEGDNIVRIHCTDDENIEGTQFRVKNGSRGNGIASVTEHTSSEDGGVNTHTFTDTDGTQHVIHTRNGRQGIQGIQGIQGEKGEKGDPLTWNDLTEQQKASLKGAQGDSAVWDSSSPGTPPDFIMANSMGISTTKSMTQKAVTNEVERIDNMLGKINTTHLAADFSNGKRSVSSQTGEYSSASTNSYATEIVVTSQTCEVKYPAITYNGQFGYAFMGDNGFVSGAKHTNSIVEDGYVVIGRDSILEALGAGAKWLRITVNDTPEANEGFDVKTLSFGGRLDDLEEKASTIEGIGTAVEGIASGMENLEEEIDGLAEDVEGVVGFISDETGTSEEDFDQTTGRNVDSTTGEFVPTSTTGRYSGEYHIKDGDVSITYGGTSYSSNYGWALLTEDGVYVYGERTTSTQDVTIDLTQYPTAKIFRWGGNSNSKTITIVGKETKQVKAIVKAKYEVFGGAFEGTLNFHFTFVKPNVNNQYATDVEKLTNTEVNGAGLLRLAKNYSRDGVPTPLIIFFVGSTGYSSYSTTEFKEEYLPYIDYLTKCGYNVMSAHGFHEGVTSRNFACPVGMAAVSNAYRWVTEHYNISRDGVYVYGRSFGGSNVVSFGYNSNIKTRAAAMLNCYIGDISNEYSNAPEKVKEFIFDNDPNFEWTTAYVAANLEKALPWSNLLRGIVDFGTRADMVYALMQAGNTMNPEHAKYKDPTTIHRVQPFPMKMWTAEDDSGITRGMKWYRETVIGTGGRCELRIMPSNYTDEDRVPESVPHHICDTAGPIYETLTTKLGYVCENIPVAYKEMVDWFYNN